MTTLRDPKLGYHWLWLNPIVYIYTIVCGIKTKYTAHKHNTRIQKIRKSDKEIDDLLKLSGH